MGDASMTRGDSAKAYRLLIHTSCGKLSSPGDDLARGLSPRCPALCLPCSRPCHPPHKEIARNNQCCGPAIATRSGVICFSSVSLTTLEHALTVVLLPDGTDRVAIAIG